MSENIPDHHINKVIMCQFLYFCIFFFFLYRMMEQSLHGEVMKTQDLPYVVVSVSNNPHGYKLAWDFLRANWEVMIKKSVEPLTGKIEYF